jgi:hypothetical protein
MIGHVVYFTLKENTAEGRQRLTDACRKYLAHHPGTVFFATGTLAEDFRRDVNVRDWDVALHLVFTDKAAHDRYQEHPDHVAFVNENKETWARVRVFDSEVAR